MGNLLRIMNDEPLRLVKDDTNASTPYNDMANQFFKREKVKDSVKDDKKSPLKAQGNSEDGNNDTPKISNTQENIDEAETT